ncbi:MAG: patatin-like phospholipase family protein [Verrucomicrobiales bacterium]
MLVQGQRRAAPARAGRRDRRARRRLPPRRSDLPPRVGFLRGEKIRERLRKSIDDAAFSDLARPLHVVATDLNTLERAVFSRGKVAETVHASLAMPGVCAPVALGGVRYTDGATSSPLPVDVLEEMGVERIIAVSVLPSLADLARLEQERGDPRIRRLGASSGAGCTGRSTTSPEATSSTP